MPSEWCLATIRHGETDYNRETRYAGSIDVPLNETGRRDAKVASRKVGSMLFDVTIASPLNRAMETAQILTEGHMEIIPCHYAQERNYGVLQGLTSADVESIRPPIHFIKVGGDYHSLNPPKAETFEEVRARGERLHRYILTHHMGRRVLLVSHGVFLQQFHGVLRRQNWVEALAAHVGNLELNIFHLKDDSVLSEDRFRLTDHKQVDF